MQKSSPIKLSPAQALQGTRNVQLAESNMAPLMRIRERFTKEKPFKNLRIGMALHVTKETAVLVETLVAGGAKVAIASCNPLSTQDDVVAYLTKKGIATYAYKGESTKDYYRFIKNVIEFKPHITIDDGCDLVYEIHQHNAELIPQILGGCEETTTGVVRLKAMEKDGALKYPVVAVNDNKTKHLFDNYYGTGQSTWDGIIRATNLLIAGKTVVVAGYGSCGRGVALRAQGMGAHVIVTEVDAVRALQAHMDGYMVMPMNQAAPLGDVFITVTGDKHVIDEQHMKKMKSGAILANSGHFNSEINLDALEKMATAKKEIRPFMTEYTISNSKKLPNPKEGANLNKSAKVLYVLGEGRLINLAAAEGHPSEVMALSFCGQALAAEWIAKNQIPKRTLSNAVYTLPDSVDVTIAKTALTAFGVSIDTLTAEQKAYLSGWKEGT